MNDYVGSLSILVVVMVVVGLLLVEAATVEGQ